MKTPTSKRLKDFVLTISDVELSDDKTPYAVTYVYRGDVVDAKKLLAAIANACEHVDQLKS